MRRMLSIGVVGFWLIMLGLLVQRTWRTAPAEPAAIDNATTSNASIALRIRSLLLTCRKQ
jgi:ABC-type Fe3+-siderophore transport system permease subunit